jgi:RNA 2',3'-cyclic 3'-phosphodiesterase
MSESPVPGGTRTFIAIGLDPHLQAALQELIAGLRRRLPSVTFVDPANLHLTLVFLGSLTNGELAAAFRATLVAAADCRPFRLSLAQLGFFGSPAMPRVVWAGIAGEIDSLRRLQASLESRLAEQQVPLTRGEQHPFSPHLTLARLKRPLPEPERQQLSLVTKKPGASSTQTSMRVTHIVVMKSELVRPAARYTRLRVCPLAGCDTISAKSANEPGLTDERGDPTHGCG